MKKNVICAVDVNDYDQDVIDLAATFARQFGVDLDLVHTTLFPDPNNAAWPAYLGSPNVLIEDNHRLRKIRTNVPDVAVNHHHLSGFPVEKILDFVEKQDPPLLVLGTHARRGVARIFGSVASKILRHASCPVMVLRQRQNSQDFADVKQESTLMNSTTDILDAIKVGDAMSPVEVYDFTDPET